MRLIDADALLAGEKRPRTRIYEGCCGDLYWGYERREEWQRWMDKVRAAPTVDAVPVVRCRDCRHRGDGVICRMVLWDDTGVKYDCTSDSGYCQKGERKEIKHEGD